MLRVGWMEFFPSFFHCIFPSHFPWLVGKERNESNTNKKRTIYIYIYTNIKWLRQHAATPPSLNGPQGAQRAPKGRQEISGASRPQKQIRLEKCCPKQLLNPKTDQYEAILRTISVFLWFWRRPNAHLKKGGSCRNVFLCGFSTSWLFRQSGGSQGRV